ncbi:neuroblastoma-amplified sequence-like [Elysia marginata]|uniref:Neuroblastoma-amplified sequence-like n=1 Tax=Elysia marginata TaxID=1093978 RepID=A0AAV4F501_9GAST|nr:neuroblastoma-amplified sequence-like [Elysia marginata]
MSLVSAAQRVWASRQGLPTLPRHRPLSYPHRIGANQEEGAPFLAYSLTSVDQTQQALKSEFRFLRPKLNSTIGEHKQSNMADAEDVETKSRDNILYDLSVLSEWTFKNELFTRSNREKHNVSFVGRVASIMRRSAWTFLRTVGVSMQSPTPCILPEQLVRLKGSQCSWKLAISNTGNWVAIAQENCIEIRTQRDSLENVFRRCQFPADPHPQWRCVAWSEDETMVACSRSSGAVDIFEISGALVSTIPGASHDDSSAPDLSDAVAALVFTDFKPPDEKWDYELLVISHHGRLVSYYVSRYNSHKVRFTHVLAGEYPRGVSSAVYDSRHRLLLVGGTGVVDTTGSLSLARASGISAWRLLSDAPFCKLVTDYDEDKQKAKNAVSIFSKFNVANMVQWNSAPVDGIFMLCRSPGSNLLVALHFSGKLSLWELPSLRLRREFELQDQPDWEELSPAFEENPTKRKRIKDLIPHKQLLDVNFWSEDQLILARCTGAVSVVSSEDLHNMLGKSPEWYEPSPHITQALNGGFLGMEVECFCVLVVCLMV